jgi:hypothetical protein
MNDTKFQPGKKHMIRYEIRGRGLYDKRNRRIAIFHGSAIYDEQNQRVAIVRGDELFDTDDRKMATLRGSDIYDAHSLKVGSLSDVEDSISCTAIGVVQVALWYCFVRQ